MAKIKRKRVFETGLTSTHSIDLNLHERQLLNELQEEVRRLRALEQKIKSNTIVSYDDSEVFAEIARLKQSVDRYIRNLESLGFKP